LTLSGRRPNFRRRYSKLCGNEDLFLTTAKKSLPTTKKSIYLYYDFNKQTIY